MAEEKTSQTYIDEIIETSRKVAAVIEEDPLIAMMVVDSLPKNYNRRPFYAGIAVSLQSAYDENSSAMEAGQRRQLRDLIRGYKVESGFFRAQNYEQKRK